MFTRQSVVYIGQSLSIAGQCLSMYRQDEAAARACAFYARRKKVPQR